jgi:hypothetical protein
VTFVQISINGFVPATSPNLEISIRANYRLRFYLQRCR